jgi:hypothetical protein
MRYLFGWESDSVRVPITPVAMETLAAAGARGPQENG